VKIVRQRNGGQLAAFVTGIEHASGDLIFFLDADDKYEPTHIESVTRSFCDHKDVSFVFTAHRLFGNLEGVVRYLPESLNLGFSMIAALKGRIFIGSVTSTLAIRRNLALALLPAMRQAAPLWRIRADDCLVYGASLAGARKYFLSDPTVLYRVHGDNGLFGREYAPSEHLIHGFRRDTFTEILCRHVGLGPSVRLQVVPEFLSIERPTRAHLREYIWLNRQCQPSAWKRLKGRVRMHLHYRRNHIAWPGDKHFDFRHHG
jgi:glycosyltransferase involved in cell wall biosynthesis